MTKQHEPHQKPTFDFMQAMRKPHGIAILLVILGIAGWAVWTFWVW